MPDANILFANQPTATPSETMRSVLQNQSAFNEFQQQPMRNALLQSQAEGAQLQNQAEQYKFQLQDLAADWGTVKPLLASGDMKNANVAIAQRIQKIQQRGGDPSDTIELRDRINSGQITPEKAIAEVDGALEGARSAGILDRGLKQADPYFSTFQTSTGVYQQNARTGEIQKIQDESGNPVLPVSADARVQGDVSRSREQAKSDVQLDMKPQIEAKTTEAKAKAGAKAEAEISLPQTIATAEYSLNVIDQIKNHPGLDVATGASSKLDPRNYTPGTDAYNVKVLIDQIQGQTFLQAFETLKGGGQITEVEGNKAQAAIARINQSQSKEEFVKALDEFQGIIQKGMERAKKKAGPAAQSQGQPAAGGGVKFLGFE